MTKTGDGRWDALEGWLARVAGAERASVISIDKLSGGAIQENWGVSVRIEGGPHAGEHDWVLRTNSPSGLATSLGRAEEYALLQSAWRAGVTVPEPIFLCADHSVTGSPFYVMTRLPGVAEGHRLVRDPAVKARGEDLAERLGRELARIHSITPPSEDLSFLVIPGETPALARIANYRRYLDTLGEARPALEWALRWAERRAPDRGEIVLCHSDFRTGNYLVANGHLTGILDWEFAAWSDPMEDLGWFCYRYWRFGAEDREAGGIGSRDAFYRGYEAESGRHVQRDLIPYWEVMAAIRWGVIALQQGARHTTGNEESLELLLTGLRAPEMEMDALSAIVRIEGRVPA